MIVGITGSKGAGKSSLLMGITAALKARGRTVGGIISARQSRNGESSGYELLNLTKGEVELLATIDEPSPESAADYLQLCHFYFSRQALRAGNDAILQGMKADCLIIDEIGFWEMSSGGWAEHLHRLKDRRKPILLGLRIGVAQDLFFRYGVELTRHIRLDIDDKDSLHHLLLEEILHDLNCAD